MTLMSSPSDASVAPRWQDLRRELVRFVAARVRDEATADDIVHEVLLRSFRALEGAETPVRLRAWLYRATRNAIVDHYRSRRPHDELPDELPAPPAESDVAAERELAGCLRPLLDGLGPEYRQALVLAEVEGMPQREIARREGLSLSGAKSRVQRARRMLRDALLDCCRIELDRRGGVRDWESRGGSCGSCSTDSA